MKKPELLVKEFLREITDDDLSFLLLKFRNGLGSDKADVANYLSRNKNIDTWLASASGPKEWFDMMHVIERCVWDENKRRDEEEEESDAASK